MVFTWENHLGLCKVSAKTWRIGTYAYNWLGSIYELVPEEKRYDDAGELVVPAEWGGQKIRGLPDGEYLETDELVTVDFFEFSPASLESAKTFCTEQGWNEVARFDLTWLRVVAQVNPTLPLSRYKAFKGKPVLRTSYDTNPVYAGTAELGIFSTSALTEIWAWDSENGAECVATVNGEFDLKSVVRAMVVGDRFVGPVDWDTLRITGIGLPYGLLLALAWDGEESSKASARLLSLWTTDQIALVLRRKGFSALDLRHLGAQALELANELEVDVGDVERLAVPSEFDEDSVLKSMTEGIRRGHRIVGGVRPVTRSQSHRSRRRLTPSLRLF